MKDSDLNFEDKLWKAANKLRKKIEVHEYKYVVLGLVFLRYVSFAFEERQKNILTGDVTKFPQKFAPEIIEDIEIYQANGTLYVSVRNGYFSTVILNHALNLFHGLFQNPKSSSAKHLSTYIDRVGFFCIIYADGVMGIYDK